MFLSKKSCYFPYKVAKKKIRCRKNTFLTKIVLLFFRIIRPLFFFIRLEHDEGGGTVRPIKKTTNLSQSGEVPKVGCWKSFWKKVFRWEGGGEGCEGCLRFTILRFLCFGLLSCTLKWDDLFLKKIWCPLQKWGLKNQLASLVDHFDRCFSHTTGEGLQLWCWSLIELFGGWEPLQFAMSRAYIQKSRSTIPGKHPQN